MEKGLNHLNIFSPLFKQAKTTRSCFILKELPRCFTIKEQPHYYSNTELLLLTTTTEQLQCLLISEPRHCSSILGIPRRMILDSLHFLATQTFKINFKNSYPGTGLTLTWTLESITDLKTTLTNLINTQRETQ